MTREVSAVEAYSSPRRWKILVVLLVILALALVALGALIFGGVMLWRALNSPTPHYAAIEDHFKYGSIGSETNSGVPYKIWKALPELYPEDFGHRKDYAGFGFLYEKDARGVQKELPIGVSRRQVAGVDVVWLNCASCHTGTWRESDGAPRRIVAGMPSNNLDFYRFVATVSKAGADERMAPDILIPAIEKQQGEFGPVEELIWRLGVLPRFREGLLRVNRRIGELLPLQPPWGPGRVDTFNPYKLLQFDIPVAGLAPSERIGAADFPAVFNQRPRAGMNLHWDGNNASLQERNLSAAIGAGVTPESVDHDSIERVAAWLGGLAPPPSPHQPDSAAVARGKATYMGACAQCHGWQDGGRYVFKGAHLGQVVPNRHLGVDDARLNSYTPRMRELQLERMFAGTPYQFRHFKKTDGYANLPLDGLWLRGPYLHNGSVPTLTALLTPPAQRPVAFDRSSDVIDRVNGGFNSPACDPARPVPGRFCFDTRQPGNGAGGHIYGVGMTPEQKADLVAYLLTF